MPYLCVDLHTHLVLLYILSSGRPTKRRCSGIRCPVQIGEERKKKNYAKKKMQTDPNGDTNGYGEKRVGKNLFCTVTVP
jgi:hypothetical protein